MSSRWLARELAKNDKTLVGFWPFQDNPLDYSGLAHHGQCQTDSGPTSYFPFCGSGRRGVAFTPDNMMYVTVPYNSDFILPNSFTVSLWYYGLNPGNGSLMSLQNSQQFGFSFDLLNNNESAFSFTAYILNDYTPVTISVPWTPAGRWYHFVFVYDAKANVLSAYIDGRLVNSVFSSGNNVFNGVTPYDYILQFGNSVGPGYREIAQYGRSSIALARIYKRALSANDIVRLHARESDLNMPRRNVMVAGASESSINNSIPLYLAAGSDNILPLYMLGGYPSTNNSCTLYIEAPYGDTASIPLFISGPNPATGTIPLYISGPQPYSKYTDLYTHGSASQTGTIPLCIHGKQKINNNFSLYLNCRASINTGMDLFVNAQPHNFNSAPIIPLNITGNRSGVKGMTDWLPMVMSGAPLTSFMNLFLQGDGRNHLSSSMDLFIHGSPYYAGKWAPLFLENTQKGTTAFTPLLIIGSGNLVPTGTPYAQAMNLFIKRWPSNVVPLFIACASPVNESVSLFVESHNMENNVVPMAIPNTTGLYDNNKGNEPVPLYVSGY